MNYLVKIIIVAVLLSLSFTDNLIAQPIAFGGGYGTEALPYLIYTKAHLEELADSVEMSNSDDYPHNWSYDKYFMVMNDIGPIERSIGCGTPYNSRTDYFNGNFDGQNYTITLMMDANTGYCASGLFGFCYTNAVIKNVIIDGYVNQLSAYYTTSPGSIAGAIIGSEIINCINYAEITGTYCAGGIVGMVSTYNYTSTLVLTVIEDCINYGEVKCNSAAGSGGIVGGNQSDDSLLITGCINNGNIIGIIYGSTSVGGIIGYWRNNTNDFNVIENCINFGEVKGTSWAGGIIGWVTEGWYGGNLYLANNVNCGYIKIDSTYMYSYGYGIAGGIVGCIALGYGVAPHTITNCLNIGNIEGNSAGGIFGNTMDYNGDVFISNCTNAGFIKANTIAGGIVGDTLMQNYNIINCINTGVIEGETGITGGIAGEE